ncbi:MAG TPA: TonB-dependent receptor [Steroidobacteraceae bacterium]|nr:TonB-dependent receptor [Steroidobacteraceae bacterium]
MTIQHRSLRLAVGCILALASSVAAAQQSATGELEEIIVTGSQVRLPEPFAGGQVAVGGRAGVLGNLDTLETPFSSTSYTAELLLNQQAKSVADALLNDPNVRVARGFGNFQELFMIRGFPAYSDDMTYNGVYGILPRQFVAAEFLERVELFRGASAFLNGAAPGGSNLGGTVNLVPKRAPDESLTRLTAGYESWAAGHVGLDVGRRFGPDKATGIRANALYRDGETSVEDQDRTLKVLSFGVDYRGEKLRLAADVGYQDHHIDAPRPSVTPSFDSTSVPEPPSATTNFAQSWTFTDEEQLFGVVRAEYDIAPNVSIWAAAGMREGDEHNVLANPTSNAAGVTSTYRFDNVREDSVYSGEIGLRWDFATGPLEHRIIVSGSLFNIQSNNAYAFSDFGGFAGSLYQPFDVAPPVTDALVGGDMSDPQKTLEVETTSYAIADMIGMFDGKLIVTLGAREQNIRQDDFFYFSNSWTKYDESAVTPVGGIVFRPTESLSLFANYVEGLVKGETSQTVVGGVPVSNGGATLDPYTTDQVELGLKYETGAFGLSLSAFELSRGFGVYDVTATDDAGLPTEYEFREGGEQRHRGVEAGVYGEPLQGFRVIGGVTWLDAELTTTDGGLNEGNTPIGAPELQANFNVEWDVPAARGLTLEARAMYTSSQYVDTANTLEIDSWTRFDLGARFATEFSGVPVSFRARIDNLLNDADWISAGGYPNFGYMVLGAPRTVSVSASVDF